MSFVSKVTLPDNNSYDLKDKLANVYCLCTTTAAAAQKEVIINNFELVNGTTIHITFSNINSAANPTLKINNLDAIPIYLSSTGVNLWDANETVSLTYDGTYWRINNNSAARKLLHSLTFGAGQEYVFDGSQDVTVPVYNGTIY